MTYKLDGKVVKIIAKRSENRVRLWTVELPDGSTKEVRYRDLIRLEPEQFRLESYDSSFQYGARRDRPLTRATFTAEELRLITPAQRAEFERKGSVTHKVKALWLRQNAERAQRHPKSKFWSKYSAEKTSR
jgi:hypothetical protein